MQRAAALESRRTIRVSGCRGGWTFPWSKALQDEIVRPSRVASVIVAARPQPQSWPGLLSRLFGREKASEETVVTRMHFAADPQDVWNGLQFYEEVRGRPPFPLNLLMPKAVRTEGKKDAVGNRVRCIYEGRLCNHPLCLTSVPALALAFPREDGDASASRPRIERHACRDL
jgi:hypothetical protein